MLHQWCAGRAAARDELIEVLYADLKRVAQQRLHGDALRVELAPTELVHECALRLLDADDVAWRDRAHFLAVAANVMRRVLVDRARRRNAGKRAGNEVTLLTQHASTVRPIELEALDQALSALERVSAERAAIVELRFFGGLNTDEIAAALGVSASTVKRSWRAARAWLLTNLEAGDT